MKCKKLAAFKILVALASLVFLSSCLKTRSEVNGTYQSQVYTKKQADNQKQQTSLEPSEVVAKFDERDETIRTLNGRIETLENQLAVLQKEKQENTDPQKLQMLQETLIKMEAQIAKQEAELNARPSDAKVTVPAAAAGSAASSASKSSFDVAQDYFAKKDFKNAILEYQKFVDANTKSKNKEITKLIPEAKYKIGLSFEAMGLKDEARSFYEEVAAQHGATEFGKKAKLKVSKSKK